MAVGRRKPDFHAFTQTYNGVAGQLRTTVGICEAFDPKAQPDQLPAVHETTALWDTGASKSVITPATVAALGLSPAGLTGIHTAGGHSERMTYMVNFILPNKVGVVGVQVSECDASNNDLFGALIGMDIIGMGDFSITNMNGLTVMSFRTPSVATIDYVAEAGARKSRRLSPGDPCWCGSGKKYRRCHGLSKA